MYNVVINTEEIVRDGVTYIRKTWSRGHVTEEVKPEPIEPIEQDESIDTETLLCEILSVAEYNSCLVEMSLDF